MALSYAIKKKPSGGVARRNIVDITTDASYAAGGYTLSAVSCGVTRIDGLSYVGGTAGFLPSYNPSTGKLQFYKTGAALSGALAEAAVNEATLNAAVWRFEVVGDSLL